jgi:parallel beta-helix repeat protein
LICVWVSLLILRSIVDFWEVSTWGSSGFNDDDDSIEWLCSSSDCSIVGNVVDDNVDSIVVYSEKGKSIN